MGPSTGTSGVRLLLTYVGVALVLGLVVTLVLAAGIRVTGHESSDWAAISAIASAIVAIATVLAAGTVGFTAKEFDRRAQEFEEQRTDGQKRERVSRRPYVRADIAFVDYHQANFHPPSSNGIYSPTELGIEAEVQSALADARALPGDEAYRLMLWLSNLQTESLGIADRIRIDIAFAWTTVDAPEVTQGRQLSLSLAYLAPNQVTTIEIGAVRRDLHSFAAEIKAVDYEDLFADGARDSHGAMIMVYSKNGVRNERKVLRDRPIETAARDDRRDP